MSGDRQDKSKAVTGVFQKQSSKKRKSDVNSLSPTSVKKFKWNGTEHTSDEICNQICKGETHLASTQWWRELMFSYASSSNGPRVKSEEIFRKNIFALVYGIDKCVRNPVQWSREDTNIFFNKVTNFIGSWKNQLQRENADHKVFSERENLENKRGLVTNRLNLLTSVYQESLKFIKFSATQKKIIESKVKNLNDVVHEFDEIEQSVLSESFLKTLLKSKVNELNEAWKQADEYREELGKAQDSLKDHLKCNESSMAIELKNKDHELNVARKQADEYREELRKAQDSLKDHLKCNESTMATELKNKDHELNVARKQADEYCEELRRTRDSLQEAYSQFNKSFLASELLKTTNSELNDARKQADEYLEKLKLIQNSLKESCLKLNAPMPTNNKQTQVDKRVTFEECLQDKVKQLNDLKNQLEKTVKKQQETEDELTETQEQLQSFVAKSREMVQTKQKDINKKLTDIQTLLLMKNPNYRPNCQIENESLSKEEKIFKDIKAIIEYDIKSSADDNTCKLNSTETDLQTNGRSTSLRVSEYEMHFFSLIAAFLKITPFPVTSHTVYSYVSNIDNVVDLQFVETLLRKFPSIFKEVAGTPGSMEKFWIYLDLKPVITI